MNEPLIIPVTLAGKTADAALVVLGCSGPNLCERDIIQAFQVAGSPGLSVDFNDGKPLSGVVSAMAATLREENADLFTPGLGLFKGKPVHLQLCEGAVP